MSNNLHLTLDERNIIEQELNLNHSFKSIALLLDKDPSTISKEVKKSWGRKLLKFSTPTINIESFI